METCFNYTGKVAYFSSDERKWIDKIMKFKEEHPEDVEIIRMPKDNDGCIYAKVPACWLRVQPKRKVELTEEERAVLRERMLAIRRTQN